jgi:prepilin-type N-terminal cleavage/methylation domain-containing protein
MRRLVWTGSKRLTLHKTLAPTPPASNRVAGFSLVELAVVLVIVAVLAGIGLSLVGSMVQNAGSSSTIKKEETLKLAFIAYLRNYKRLPCPDTDFATADGIENRTATTGTPPMPDVTKPCSADAGLVPYATLGLPREAGLDGYGNWFTYYVSRVTVTTNAPNRDWTLTSDFTASPPLRGFTPGNVGNYSVDGEGGAHLSNSSNPETLGVIVVVSHGPNGFGARTLKGTLNAAPPTGTDEADNASGSGSTVLHQRATTDNAGATGGAFDDIVMVLRPADLLGPLFADSSLKPAPALTQENLNALRDAMVAAIPLVPPCSIPGSLPGGTGAMGYDGWGNPFAYTPPPSPLPPTAAGNSTLFTLTATIPSGSSSVTVGPSGTVAGAVLKTTYSALNTACP